MEKLDLILKKLEIIETDIKYIKEKIDTDIYNNSIKLNNHIDFIESVYNKLKSPIDYISNRKYFSIKNT